MTRAYASNKRALAICDRCGVSTLLRKLKKQYLKQRDTGLLVCQSCLDKDHPQLMLGTFPIDDPQALRNPRPDDAELEAVRDTQWGWNPVGGGNSLTDAPNSLAAVAAVGTVTVVV